MKVTSIMPVEYFISSQADIANRNLFSFICVTLGILVSNFNEYFMFLLLLYWE
jgi:hypothetical protein